MRDVTVDQAEKMGILRFVNAWSSRFRVQENAAIGFVVLQSAEILGLIILFAIHFPWVTIE